MKIYTKESLIDALKVIRNRGWIPNARPGNAGGIGNTLEDLLGIRENNLPIPKVLKKQICLRKPQIKPGRNGKKPRNINPL